MTDAAEDVKEETSAQNETKASDEDKDAAKDEEVSKIKKAAKKAEEDKESTETAPIYVVKEWQFQAQNGNILSFKDWPGLYNLNGYAEFEIEGLPDGTYDTLYNTKDNKGTLEVKNGVGTFRVNLQYGDGNGVSYSVWGTQHFIILGVPVGIEYTVTEKEEKVFVGEEEIEVDWEISNFARVRNENGGVYSIPSLPSFDKGNSVSSKVIEDKEDIKFIDQSSTADATMNGSGQGNWVEFQNVKIIDVEATIKKEVKGKDDGSEYEILIIPYNWADSLTRYNVAAPYSVDGVRSLDIGREDADELIDLDFYKTDIRHIYQLTIPDHGDNLYAYFESWMGQIEKTNIVDAGLNSIYILDLAKKVVDQVNANTNNFFADEGAHFLETAQKLDDLAKSKGYSNAYEYFFEYFSGEMDKATIDEEYQALIDQFIEEHQEAGVTKADMIYMHMVGSLFLIEGLNLQGLNLEKYEDFDYGDMFILDYIDEEYYETVTKMIKTIHTIKNGETVDVSEYLELEDTNMVFVYEKNYTGDNYRRTGVVTNWINPKDWTAKDILLGDKIQLENTITNIKPVGYAQIEATKKLEGADLVEKQFEFELKDSSGNVISTATNDAEGNIKFDSLEYLLSNTSEEITYTISEVNDDQADVTYDTHEEKVVVKVEDVGTENLSVTVTYDEDGAVFTNKYSEKEEEKITTQSGEKESSSETTTQRVKDESTTAKKTTTTTTSRTSPKTGDEAVVWPYILILIAAACAGTYLVYRRRKHNN